MNPKNEESQTIVFRYLFAISLRVYAVEYFGIKHWKANGKLNLMIASEIRIKRLQPEKLRNMFEQIQKMKKNHVCPVQYVHNNPNILLLTSHRSYGSEIVPYPQTTVLKSQRL